VKICSQKANDTSKSRQKLWQSSQVNSAGAVLNLSDQVKILNLFER
jgi:hypothetical protein